MLSHKADEYVPEGSDCAVVPMNQSNKQERSWAEVGEGRAWTKENIVGSDTSPTQRGVTVSQGLDGVNLTMLAPGSNGFVGYGDATLSQKIFDIAKAQSKPVVQPNGMADDLGWKAMLSIERFHRPIVAHRP